VRALEATARLRSLTRAAGELSVTHGAISHQLKALEAELGVRLVERSGRGIRLTDEGERFAARVRVASDELGARCAKPTDRANPARLRVTTTPSFAGAMVAPRACSASARAPGIDLDVSATMQLIDLARESIDVAIRYGFGHWPGLHAEHLHDDAFFPVASPRLVGARPPEFPRTSRRFPLLRNEDEPWKPWFEGRRARLAEPARGPGFEDAAFLVQTAIAGHGVALARAVAGRRRPAHRRARAPDRRRGRDAAQLLLRLPAARRRHAQGRGVARVAARRVRARRRAGQRSIGIRTPFAFATSIAFA
jgi:LysR family glycine cleavage system transcriptional activator